MPDWVTHILAGWISAKSTRLDVGLVILGSLIPDLAKLDMIFTWVGLKHVHFFSFIHTPLVALLIGGCISLLFASKKAFLALSLGIFTHFLLDGLLMNFSGGIRFLYPLSWEEFGLPLVKGDEYWLLLVFIVVFVGMVLFSYFKNRNLREAVD